MHTGSPNGGAGVVSSDGEFVISGLPIIFMTSQHQFRYLVYTRHVNSFFCGGTARHS